MGRLMGVPDSYPLIPSIEQSILSAIRAEVEKQAEREMDRVVVESSVC